MVLAHLRAGARESMERSQISTDPVHHIESPLASALGSGAARLLSLHCLLHDAELRFECRQALEELPVSPYLPTEVAQEILRSGERRVFVVSYPWRSAEHPDPTSTYMHRLISFLQWLVVEHSISEAEQHRCGVFVDWMCLWQGQRTQQQERDFNLGIGVMTSMFGSLHGSCVLRLSSVEPPRPAFLDGRARLFTDSSVHDAADAEAHIRSALPDESRGLVSVEPLRMGTTFKKGAYDLLFNTQEQAEAAVAASAGTNIKIYPGWNTRPYWQRSWCVHEDAIAKLASGISHAVPSMQKQQRVSKLYDISSLSGTYTPIEVKEPERLEEVVSRIEQSVTTNSADKSLVISSFTDFARKLSMAADPTKIYLRSSYAESGRGLREAARYGASVEELESMLNAHVPLDEPDESGMSALMEASLQGHTAAVNLFLRRGADLERQNFEPPNVNEKTLGAMRKKFERLPGSWGCTALIMASAHGHVGVVRSLIAAGANWLDPKYDELDRKGRDTMLAAMSRCDEAELFRTLAQQAISIEWSTALIVLVLVTRTGHAMERAMALRASRPTESEMHVALSNRIQLSTTALLEHLCLERSQASGVDDDGIALISLPTAVDDIFRSASGAAAMALAVRAEAKIFLSQPVMQEYVQRLWLGEVLHAAVSSTPHERHPASSSCVLLLLLAAQMPLVPIIACWPPLQQRLASSEYVGRLFLLDSPVVKFCLSTFSDVLLALIYTLSPAHTLVSSSATTQLLYVWIAAGLLAEGRQVVHTGFETYSSELFNIFDIAGLTFGLLGMLAASGSVDEVALTSGAGPVLRALACLFLWLRVARVLLASPTFGIFVLMVFRMVKDLVRFLFLEAVLLLAYTSATYKLFESPSSTSSQPSDVSLLWDGEPSCDAEFADFGRTLTLLWEGTLKSEGYFRCVQESSHPEALFLMYSYVILTVVLMLNMLIAMMGKSFDVIWESAAATYLAGFAQNALTYAALPAAPLPFSVLSLPYQLYVALASGVARRANPAQWKLLDSATPVKSEAEVLLQVMCDYVMEHEDDVAEEERWRTKMYKAFTDRFHRLEARLSKIHKEKQQVDGLAA